VASYKLVDDHRTGPGLPRLPVRWNRVVTPSPHPHMPHGSARLRGIAPRCRPVSRAIDDAEAPGRRWPRQYGPIVTAPMCRQLRGEPFLFRGNEDTPRRTPTPTRSEFRSAPLSTDPFGRSRPRCDRPRGCPSGNRVVPDHAACFGRLPPATVRCTSYFRPVLGPPLTTFSEPRCHRSRHSRSRSAVAVTPPVPRAEGASAVSGNAATVRSNCPTEPPQPSRPNLRL
jgi:hypothetical protein